MNKVSRFLKHSSLVIAVCLSSISSTLSAAPGTIENSPLFLANRAEPNIFFMVDDSGSMDVEFMTPETSIPGFGGVMRLGGGTGSFDNGVYLYLFGEGCTAIDVATNPTPACDSAGEIDDPDTHNSWNGTSGVNTYDTEYTLPTQAFIDSVYPTAGQTAQQRGVWRGRNSDYNQLYYNPDVEYLPWIGTNDAGNPFPDYKDKVTFPAGSPQTVVPIDAYYAGGATFDLTATHNIPVERIDGTDDEMSFYPAAYWVWEDTDGDTLVDANILDDNHGRVVIASGSPVCAGGLTETRANQITNNCMMRSYDDEIRNFANWFVYHRKRDYESKYAMSYVIDPAKNVRMGHATINNQGVAQIPLNSMNIDSLSGNKAALLDAMYQMDAIGGTPLRRALERAGNYYECSGTTPFGNPGSCGIQTTPAATPPGACQQNFTILISDGEYNGGNPAVGNEDGDADSFTATYYPTGTPVVQNFSFAGEPYADAETNSLADVAMDYYERDLAAGLLNKVPITCGVDENPAQHMVTFGVGFGVSGTVDLSTVPAHPQRGYASGNCTDTTPGADFTWSTGAINTGPERIDDMVHAAYNGRGEYVSAQNPQGLSDSLNGTLRRIASRTGAASAVALDASSLSANSTAYFAKFNSATWEGELSAFPIDNTGVISATPDWDAHTLLEAKAATDRAVVTFNPASGTFTGIPFRTLGSLTTAQQNDLKTTTTGLLDGAGTANTDAQARLDYLRGDHSCEASSTATCSATGKIFRDRILNAATFPNPARYKLGDIIHSSPVYVGVPPLALPNRDPFGVDGERHRDFKYGIAAASDAFTSGKNASNRTPMIYVGSNDGMLHAFNANTGEEIWGYIPNSLFATGNSDGLHKLTETDYEHKYYVDLDPTVVDAFIETSPGISDWHTVLVGGLRAGGKGLFAIDVTDPDEIIDEVTATQRESKLASRVMWEFSSADDIDMGLSYSQPQIVPIGDTGMATPIKYYVVFGNGYNSTNTATGSNPYSSKLFILKLEGPDDGVWDEGTDYWKIDSELPSGLGTGSGGSFVAYTENDRNGMSTPAVADSDSDGIADTVYAGDLKGRVWAFDINGTNENSWDVYQSGGNPNPLFTATDGDGGAGNEQPITSKPALGFNTEVATVASGGGKNTPNLMVYVGTGSYLTTADLADTNTQSFYAIWDSGESAAGHTVDRSTPADSDLVEQTISTDTAVNGDTVRIIDPTSPVNYPTDFGWYMDLPTSGERVIVDPQVLAGIAFFSTVIPSTDPCGFGGTSWSMFADAMTGTAPSQSLVDFDSSGGIDAGDETSGGHVAAGTSEDRIIFDSTTAGGGGGGGGLNCPSGFQKYIEIITLSDGTTKSIEKCLPNGTKLGRASWRELGF